MEKSISLPNGADTMSRFISRLLSWLYAPFVLIEHVKALWAASRFQKQLTITQDNLNGIVNDDIVLFATLYNEAALLPQFLRHYRQLGVNHFIFIDNHSTDDSVELVSNDNDVSIFHTSDSYKSANFGMHWVNALLRRYGSGRWCVVCDIDEHLIFHSPDKAAPYSVDTDPPLKSLCQRLEKRHQQAFYTLMLDMYPKQHLHTSAQLFKGEEASLIESCPYFDQSGFQYTYNKKYLSQMIRGGVRQRLLYEQQADKGPALQKIPLIKWQPYFAYLSSMHTVSPRRLNSCFEERETGALLHFKFSPGYINKVIQEQTRRQHYDNSSEYTRYQQLLSCAVFYAKDISARYQSSEQLSALGLIKALPRIDSDAQIIPQQHRQDQEQRQGQDKNQKQVQDQDQDQEKVAAKLRDNGKAKAIKNG
ncbi:glycosyltransferase family 2 protein [Thalassotalea litorea]|nr:glycosyltransferase family 2 protein [Thalassotalea litorea]